MSSDDNGSALMAAFQSKGKRSAPPSTRRQTSFSPGDFISDQSSATEGRRTTRKPMPPRKATAVKVAPVRNRHEYTYYEPRETVKKILREYDQRGTLMYTVKLDDGAIKEATFDELLDLDNGREAFDDFEKHNDGVDSSTSAGPDMRLRNRPKRNRDAEDNGFLNVVGLDLSSSDDELASPEPRHQRGAPRKAGRPRKITTYVSSSESDGNTKKRRRRKPLEGPARRSNRNSSKALSYSLDDEDGLSDEDDSDSDGDILRSDVMGSRKRKRGRPARSKSIQQMSRIGTRQSDRATRATNNMREAQENDIYRSDSEPKQTAPKIVSAKEIFETLPRDNLFRARHVEGCEVCYKGPSLAPLIYCQGCSLSYHKNCLGNRSGREHLVTKVGDEQYVLQCRRCVNIYKKKDSTSPDLSMCQDCHHQGPACRPFRHSKTSAQEQRERDENDGLDPVVHVSPRLINNARNVLFRCTKCARAYHYHHLPPLSQYSMDISRDEDEIADERFAEYSKKWLCKECDETEDLKVGGLVAWRPADVETYRPGTSCYMMNEDEKQYLIKWEGQSYFRSTWFSGAWTWGVTAPSTRKAFFKREDGPKMRTEDAIPEEYLRIDIVLDIKYTSYVDVQSEEILKARIKEVDKALIKYKGLGYEDAVWEKVPTPEDGDRWLDFVTAYNDWVAGRYIRYPKQAALRGRLEKVRASPFDKLEKQKQPDNLVGGELMKYQLEGLNWLYYQWYSQNNGILADEMGLGKTIQVIAFMATLIEEHNCFPFLVVVPNSTCANWRREIKQWVPSLRVVTFFGSSTARDMASKYEMFPDNSKELRAHIVVTSYEAATDDSCRRIFRGISWAGLIVDEGQRLKNDKSQLYAALTAVKAPYRLLLTGTPLQNNARELFNLLQFLDETINAAELEEKYGEPTSENIRELHDHIRPFILRRTKAQVLTFLPPLGQIIVPISLSTLQKSLYKSILAKNPELLKALFTSGNLKQQERASLSNILMQLRKCLCHPFVYSREIEERTDVQAVSHRNLVEASAKLQLLELLLPKLQERGHRVLIFSQFLDMLSIIEDFMDGMQMAYQRLDGTMGSLEKQKRIDQFNAPDSPLFAFLLSTRAGGVGINLATADTVIILDPDFNPHQDIQAISRAHRIGQKKKVLCFQLMTRGSVEEKIVRMGRKKMALDHVVVESLDAEDMEDKDVQSILKFGAAELFKDDNAETDIRFDDASIEKLLDRSQIENTAQAADNSVESQFSVARVWANDQGALEDTLMTADVEVAPPDPGVWDKILKERQAAAAAEALRRADALGRGKRARMNVDYATETQDAADGNESVTASPAKIERPIVPEKPKRKKKDASEDDTDFYAESESEAESVPAQPDQEEVQTEATKLQTKVPKQRDLYKQNGKGASEPDPKPLPKPGPPPDGRPRGPPGITVIPRKPAKLPTNKSPSNRSVVKPFERAKLPIRSPMGPTFRPELLPTCPACHKQHPRGACALKASGVEHCGLCGLAHFGIARTCPHIKSETQVREMLEALKSSPEKKEHVEAAIKYLRGVKGTLVQQKKRDKEKAQGGGPPLRVQQYGQPPSQQQPSQQQQSYQATPAQQGYSGVQQAYNGQMVEGYLSHYLPPQQQSQQGYQQYNRHHSNSQTVGQALRQQQQQQQQQQQYVPPPTVNPDTGRPYDEREVANALKGFLGK
ncbi:hypothetical protein DM02DRAFT_519327 [Periconia macrospinosa]|uniref:Uncharacterized protein n=1 Tax=Periconia macrospinosa TaxID=97972 RepID=A0A2V1E359_9PLEO|nr:hypothetical protein DM02DRAFT_519327 [Periconia macrospinosa]